MRTSFKEYEIIHAGHLKVDKNSDSVYKAFLSTCLGVALYDKHKKIGGLIHILLPEPLGHSYDNTPEKYASTGVPLLLEQLEAMGSKPSELHATMAGGGFVGQVSQQDIGLDIGGRSAEIALGILKKAGVTVIKSETGGFFNCTLELNMATGQTAILPPWEIELEIIEPILKPSIEDIMKTIDSLKPIPQTALKILRMFQDSRFGIDDITEELGTDQVLSAQTMKICNSVLFMGAQPIETLKDAVLLMGEGLLVQSVITAAIRSYFKQTGSSGYSLCKGGLYFHAVAVAVIAEKLALKTGKINPAQAYTVGLLHDIGKTILDQYLADCAPLFFRKQNQYLADMTILEKKILGITHCEAGMFLAKKWHLSQTLTQVIAHHHSPENTSSHDDIVCIVYLADLLAGKFQAGVSMALMQTKSLEYALQKLEITMDDIPEIISRIPFELFISNDNIQEFSEEDVHEE